MQQIQLIFKKYFRSCSNRSQFEIIFLLLRLQQNLQPCGQPDLDAAHRQIHKCAVDSWNAKESGNVELALEYFQKCYDAYGVYSNKIEDFKSYMRTIGYTDETETVTFRK